MVLAPETNEEGYEMRPIGWRPGTGYRDDASPSDEIYRTYDDAVEWIRKREREQYLDTLNNLLSGIKLIVSDILYSGTIFEHEEYVGAGEGQSPHIPHDIAGGGMGGDVYVWYPGFHYNSGTGAYEPHDVPELPQQLLMLIQKGDGLYVFDMFKEYLALEADGVDAMIPRPYSRDGELIDFETYQNVCVSLNRNLPLDEMKERLLVEIEAAIAKKITWQTSGIPSSFTWEVVDDIAQVFFDMNPQISKNYGDGNYRWQNAVDEFEYKSSDAWDCTEDMNVETGAEYQQRMLYGGCAGSSATYFSYPSMGNFPYFVEPVILD